MIGAILQARLRSTRLPMKILRNIGRYTIIEHCLRAMQRMTVDRRIIATDPQSYAILGRYARRYGAEVVAGPTHDVLRRFAVSARTFGLRTIVRLTADNPFVSHEYANAAVAEFASRRCDYFHYTDLPLGCGVEVFSRSALATAHMHARLPYEREHVTPYIYTPAHAFTVVHAAALQNDCSHMRITIDTEKDYQTLTRLYSLCALDPSSLPLLIEAYLRING